MDKTINQDYWQDNTERIEAYLYNTMTPEERQIFEAEVAKNPDLATILAAQRAEHRFFELAMQEDLRQNITAWREEETAVNKAEQTEKETPVVPLAPQTPVVPFSRRIFQFAAAASVLLVIGFGIKTALLTPNLSNLELATTFYESPSIGSKAGVALTDIEKTIENGQFQEALSALTAFNGPTEAVQVAFLKGHCQFKLAQYTDAARTFEQIPTTTTDPLSIDRSEWLLLLSKLASGAQASEWQPLLTKITNEGHAYRKQGLELKGKL